MSGGTDSPYNTVKIVYKKGERRGQKLEKSNSQRQEEIPSFYDRRRALQQNATPTNCKKYDPSL